MFAGFFWETDCVEIGIRIVSEPSHQRAERHCASVEELECPISMHPKFGQRMPFCRSVQQLHHHRVIWFIQEAVEYWDCTLLSMG